MRFSKWHALGNSYLLVERADAGELTGDIARRLCDVSVGIGSDGVLEVLDVDGARADVRIWNPDGSVAEMSGNGTRIAAAWLARQAGAVDVVVSVGQRDVQARALGADLVETDVGRVEVGPAETLIVDGDSLALTPVDVGNQHAVIFGDTPTRAALLRLGPVIEHHPRFPARTNVQLAQAESANAVRALVWERGAGETSASGSSAVAVAAVAVARGWCESPVSVHMPGGELVVELEAGEATLIGPAVEICRGEIGL